MQKPVRAWADGTSARPGQGRPVETNDSTLGIVVWRQAEAGPRPQREPPVSPLLARWALSLGYIVAGVWKARSGRMEGRVGGAQLRCCKGFQATPASHNPPGSSAEKYFFSFALLGSRIGKGTQKGSRNAGWESMQGPFHPLCKKSISLDAPSRMSPGREQGVRNS